ncbi:hypothetical protein LX36DRAFT_584087, partial [Colletotrichum falcatum]
EACFNYLVAAQHQSPTDKEIKALNRRIKWQIENIEYSLRFVLLNLETAKLFIFVDRSFANNANCWDHKG